MATRRIELGFEGGTFLRLTVEDSAVSEMTAALKNGLPRGIEHRSSRSTHSAGIRISRCTRGAGNGNL